jgi:hypothetical protein
MNLLREVSNIKLLNQGYEVELDKFKRKDTMLRDNISELKISFEETQHRFEARISEYKQQIYLKNEYVNKMSDQIRFQKKVIADQDQKLVMGDSKEGMFVFGGI